jgi:hypothetical protein
MTQQYLFAFGSNPFGKCCPGTTDIIVRDPVDILPMLLKGNECVIDQVEVVCGTWDRTLIRLRDSEPIVEKLVLRNIQSCTLESTEKNQYHALGFEDNEPESSTARLVTADEADDFFKLGDVRESLDDFALSLASHLTLLESGSVVTTASTKNVPSGLPICIYAETLADLQTDPTSCTHSLPGPPGTTYRLATGLSANLPTRASTRYWESGTTDTEPQCLERKNAGSRRIL